MPKTLAITSSLFSLKRKTKQQSQVAYSMSTLYIMLYLLLNNKFKKVLKFSLAARLINLDKNLVIYKKKSYFADNFNEIIPNKHDKSSRIAHKRL